MARITVPFLGITTNANHKDGECSNIVNLRPKNGYLKPVPPRKTEYTLTREYSVVFVHRISNSKNWIGVTQDKKSLYVNINTPNPLKIELNLPNDPFFSEIEDIQQIGNTLTLLTNDGLRYLLWTDGTYKYLGKIPDMLPIKMGLNTTTYEDKRFYKDGIGKFWMLPIVDRDNDMDEEYKVVNKAMVNSSRLRIIEGKSTSKTPKGVKLFDAHIIRYAYRLYDGTVIKHSSPILAMPNSVISSLNKRYTNYLVKDHNEVVHDSSYVITTGYDFSISYDFSMLSDWKDVIISVDIFTSQSLGLTSEEFIKGYQGMSDNEQMLFGDANKSQIDRIKTSGLFYHSHTLKLESSTQSFCSTFLPIIEDIDKILFQELMPVDGFSHHSLSARNAVVYNNRLRLSGITTKLFSGFTANFYNWMSQYNGEHNQSFTGVHWLHTVVSIRTDEGEKIVRNAVAISTVNPITLNAFISYPDSRATKIRFLVADFNETVVYERLVVNLEPHPSLNIAYALKADLKPFFFNNSMVNIHQLPTIKSKLIEPNKLKVSEVNNPFVFPNINTYNVGVGAILNESSIVMNVSDRNYGMYPTFVFTDNGVFTMAGQTADSVHDSIQAPTYLEPPVSDVICATPYGVAFVTKRGLMMINQNSTEFLSPQLREEGEYLFLRNTKGDILNHYEDGWYEEEGAVLTENNTFPTVKFVDFLMHTSNMFYNPHNDELIIFSSITNKFCYVYDFPSQSFYFSTEKITGVVKNSFPEVFVVDGLDVKDYSKYESYADVSFITRPLYFGSTDIKTMSRIILRMMCGVVKMKFIAFHSMDSVNFYAAKGREINHTDNAPRSYMDIDLGLLARETYRQYLLSFSAFVHKDAEIRYGEFDVATRYDNDKMR